MSKIVCYSTKAFSTASASTPLSATTIERRRALIAFLARETLPVQVSWAYAGSGANLADLEKLAEKGLVALGESEIWRDPLAGWRLPRMTRRR